MKKIALLLTALALFAFTACDIIEEPFEEEGGSGPVDTNVVYKKVLIEDIGGINCGNCPDANETAHHILESYPENTFAIAVHAGYYSTPNGDQPDFRTDIGTEINDYYGVQTWPSGVVNRTKYDNKTVLNHTSWPSAVVEQTSQAADVDVVISAEYDDNTRKANISVEIEYLENQNDNADRIAVYVVEDSVIAYQYWYSHDPKHIDDFVHRHILRGGLNGTWGEVFSQAGAVKSDKFSKDYSYTIPEEFNSGHISFVAIVMNDDDTYSVKNIDWVELEAEEETGNELDENPVVLEHADNTTVQTSPFGGDQFELVWEVSLTNTADTDQTVYAGYKIISLVEGQAYSMCAGSCLPAKKEDFEAPGFTIAAGETTTSGEVSMHLQLNPDGLAPAPTGTSEVEFYFYSASCPSDTTKRTITFVAE